MEGAPNSSSTGGKPFPTQRKGSEQKSAEKRGVLKKDSRRRKLKRNEIKNLYETAISGGESMEERRPTPKSQALSIDRNMGGNVEGA